MTVPFPRTVPADAPEPPAPLLEHRAAYAFFLERQSEQRDAAEAPVGFRMSPEGVWVRDDSGFEVLTEWDEVKRLAHRHGDPATRR